MYNLFKFIEDKRPKYKVPFKLKLLYAPETLTKKDLNVKGNLYLRDTSIQSLPNDFKVEGSLDLSNTPIQSLPNGLKVGHSLYLRDTPIQSLPNGLKVGGSLYLRDTSIQSLPNDLKVEGSLYLSITPLAKELIKKGYTQNEQEELKKMFPGVKGNIYL
jgi:hypothetical protein